MRKVPNPALGQRFIRARRRQFTDEQWQKLYPHEWVCEAENQQEHLAVRYPSLSSDVGRLCSAKAPASFTVEPGSVTGRKLKNQGVLMTVCLMCGAEIPITRTLCDACRGYQKIPGGVTHG